MSKRRSAGSCGSSGSHVQGSGESVDFGVVKTKKFLRSSAGDDTAAFEQHDARGKQQGFAQIVRDENDSFSKPTRERREFTLKFGAGDGIERAKWFVHQENRWIGRKGAGDADAL